MDHPVENLTDSLIRVFTGLGDADAVVESGQGILLAGENLLIEFLAGPQAGIFDLDIHVWFEACQTYHAPGEVVDTDRLAHVEDADAVAIAHGGSLHYEAASLGNGHEEAVDLAVRDRDRTALCDLFLEARDHRAIAAQHIAETRRDGDNPRLWT